MQLYTYEQAAERLATSVWKVGQLVKQGMLPAVDVSLGQGARKHNRISEQALEDFVSRRTTRPHAGRARATRSKGVPARVPKHI